MALFSGFFKLSWITVLLAWAPAALAAAPCGYRLTSQAEIQVDPGNPHRIRVDGILVTGEDSYPLDSVLKNLGLGSEVLASLRGKKTLTVAEGYNELLPYFLDRGLAIEALDVWYHRQDIPQNLAGRRMTQFSRRYGELLIQGSAFAMPIEDGQYDLLLSHRFINNLGLEQTEMFLRETFRVLRAGGQARIYGAGAARRDWIVQTMREIYGIQVQLESREVRSLSYTADGQVKWISDHLVVITKRW